MRQKKYKNGHDWTLLRYWGMIEEKQKENKDDEQKNSGYWKITPKGIDFVLNKIFVEEKVYIYNNTVRGFSDKKVKASLKKTKEKMIGRVWKTSKYIEADFEEDLKGLITTYSENGYRDARILEHSVAWNEDQTINVNLKIEEGNKYYFGDIKFLGNTKYTDQQLQGMLRIQKGDTYNGKLLKERSTGDGSPDSEDIATLYQDNGYLFSRVMPVETRISNDSINIEIRIYEDEPTKINKVTINGNDKTNDHVIYREIRTRPGQLYSKANVVRTVRELGQLGFFDAQEISPNFINPNPNEGTIDMEYSVKETGSSQIELQGGYGGGGFIGTLGLSFNNFSLRNLFNKEAYKPLPMGDGQTLSLRLQTSRTFSTYSFSFTEPWLGGKKQKSLSISVYSSFFGKYIFLWCDVCISGHILVYLPLLNRTSGLKLNFYQFP